MNHNLIGKDARRFVRVRYDAPATCAYGENDTGTGTCLNVGGGGLRLSLPRYIRPRRRILVSLEHPFAGGRVIELKGQVAWCKPAGFDHQFHAGIRVIHDEPETALALTHLIHAGLEQSGIGVYAGSQTGGPDRASGDGGIESEVMFGMSAQDQTACREMACAV